MAAIFNHTDFWHLSGEEATNAMLKHNSKDFVTFSWVQGIMVCLVEPLIILGNAFVVYAVWKDPLKNLRCSPPNFVLQSMAIADLLVGLLLSPMHAYWLFSLAVAQKSALSYHVIYSFSSTLYGSSLAHVTLLTIDRFVAVVQPLKYRSIMTRRRINLAISLVWLYFICFGSAAFVFVNGFFVMSIVFGVQMITLLQITFCFYGVIIYRLHKNYKAWQKRILRDNVRVSQQQLYVDKEGRFAKAIAFVIFISLFFITPFVVLTCLVYFCVPCYSYPKMLFASTGLEITLSYLNSASNPFVYCWRFPKYRELLKRYFKIVFRCCTAAKRRCRKRETFDTKL